MLELDRPVRDRLLLRTVPGAVDYLFEELRTIPEITVESRRVDGLAIELAGPLRVLHGIRYFSSAAVLCEPAIAASLHSSAATGALSMLPTPIRFRVADLAQRRPPLIEALRESGWHNDPGDWQVNITPLDQTGDGTGPVCAEIGELYWTKRFGELLRAPASTNPVIAAVMTRLAKIEPGNTVVDPFCGAGTLLVSVAAMAEPAVLLGGDHDARWVAATAQNLNRRGAKAMLWRGDARAIPLPDASADRIVANLPFGKRVGSHIGNKQLYPAALAEIARLLPRKGRAVLLTEDKRLFGQSVQRTRGIRVIKEITFTTGGAHPSAYVVTTRRTR